MPSRLLGQTTQTFSDIKLAQYVNDARGTNFANISVAIASLGIGAVSYTKRPMAAFIANVLGLAMTLETVINTIIAGFDDSDLNSVVDQMEPGDKLMVVTKYYEYSTAGGVSYTYYADETYIIIQSA